MTKAANNAIGFLSPEGELIECNDYEHMSLAYELVSHMDNVPAEYKFNGVKAEEYLQMLGYIVMRARDCYALIGYRKELNSEQRIHMTAAQEAWLLEHYAEFIPEKRECVDKIFDWNGSGAIRERI